MLREIETHREIFGKTMATFSLSLYPATAGKAIEKPFADLH